MKLKSYIDDIILGTPIGTQESIPNQHFKF